MKKPYIIGIDEAGRGPLAGPLVVAGIKIATSDMRQETWIFKGIKDSKKLTAKRREEWFRLLIGHPKIEWAVARISPKIIDRINSYHAAQLGAWRVYQKLSTNNEFITNKRISEYPNSIRKFAGDSLFADQRMVLLDGSLHLPKHIPQKTIIKGDEKIPIISAASIIAKVTRDRIMLRLHKKYPQYRFDLHKGYGTKLHRERMEEWGRCEIHRASFRL